MALPQPYTRRVVPESGPMATCQMRCPEATGTLSTSAQVLPPSVLRASATPPAANINCGSSAAIAKWPTGNTAPFDGSMNRCCSAQVCAPSSER